MRHGKYAEYEFKILKFLLENPNNGLSTVPRFTAMKSVVLNRTIQKGLKIPRSSYNDVINKLVQKKFVEKIYESEYAPYALGLGLTKKGYMFCINSYKGKTIVRTN